MSTTPLRSHHWLRMTLRNTLICSSATAVLSVVLAGCGPKADTRHAMDKIPQIYPDLGPKQNVPTFMAGSIWERTELSNIDPFPISSYGLVGRLRGTGDSTAPTPVRSWMLREMARHSFGNRLLPGYADISPEQVLNSPNFAIVEVWSFIPPGARQGDWIDAHVRALPRNQTTSLSNGVLYETELKDRGVDPSNPNITVDVLGKAKGAIVVNPVYALGGAPATTSAGKNSLRAGVVMFNTKVMQDRPIILRLRQPQRSVSRAIEGRINEYFQHVADHPKKSGGGSVVAEAQDEGVINIYVPHVYKGDWEHFVGVATHVYMNNASSFASARAKELVAAAQSPDAPLMDISYAWEALGPSAIPFISPLFSGHDPNVAYAAARAAAFIGDPTGAANATLVRIAGTKNHPFQLAAITAIGSLPASTSTNQMLRGLLGSDQNLVRIEAYKVLAQNKDSAVFTQVIKGAGGEEKFILDVVPSDGPPVIFASRSGAPRIAVIGRHPTIAMPAIFTAMDSRFSISSLPNAKHVDLFYRDEHYLPQPVKMASKPDIVEIIARIGGEGSIEEQKFNFTFGEILAILQGLSSQNKIEATQKNGALALASFIMQEAPRMQDELNNAPVINEARPQADSGARQQPANETTAQGLAPAGAARPQ